MQGQGCAADEGLTYLLLQAPDGEEEEEEEGGEVKAHKPASTQREKWRRQKQSQRDRCSCRSLLAPSHEQPPWQGS